MKDAVWRRVGPRDPSMNLATAFARGLTRVLALTLALTALPAQARQGQADPTGPTIRVSAERPVDVTIRRDRWGTPHVFADTAYALFFGYGHAVAQDRLYQMEMARRSTQGRVAEMLGETFVAFDRSIRANYWPASIQRQIDRLPRAQRDILDGYADGMNAWIGRVRENPSALLPRQFDPAGPMPAPWTAFDVAMIFIGSVANRFSDANTEIDNLAMLDALRRRHGESAGWQIFEQLKWRSDPKAITTIGGDRVYRHAPMSSGPPPYALPPVGGTQPGLERLAQSPLDGALLGLSDDANRGALLAQLEQGGPATMPGFATTSNMWIVGRQHAAGGGSILLNGPQFGWFTPSYVYGIGLHGAGFEVVGNTPFGYPAILFGHNERIAWGSTAGVGDVVDIFAEQLDPADPMRYRHQGRWKTFERRLEVIRVKGGTPVAFEVLRSTHGIITRVDRGNHVAFAKARSWDGHELQSLMAWVDKTRARDWAEWKHAAARHALTINWYYADRAGSIGYAHTGFYPKRRPGHDPRLPVPGTGEMDWQGRLPFATNPQVFNPPDGVITNWNNAPMKGYPPTDAWSVLWTAADRNAELDTRLRERLARGPIDAEGMWSLIEPTSHADVNRRFFLPFLQEAVAGLAPDDDRARLVGLVTDWDGLNTDRRGTGYYDHPGGAIVDAWLQAMLKQTLADDLPADLGRGYLATGYPTPAAPNAGSVNLSPGAKVLYNVLAGRDAGVPQRFDLLNGQPRCAVVLSALDAASAELKRRHGTDPAAWRIPVAPLAFQANNFFGIPQADADEARRVAVTMNRGTENNRVVLKPAGIDAVDVVAPGQSGFIGRDGKPSPHREDQLELYLTMGSKPVWSRHEDIRRNTASSERLRSR